MSRAADVHVLDEADFGVVSPRELDQVHEFVVVDAANDHRVELQSAKERSSGRDTVEDAIELVEARQLAKAIGAQRVEADRQPMKPGVAQGLWPARRAARRLSSWRGRESQGAPRASESSGRSRRSSGSPPVRRTLSTPSDVKTSTSVSISSNCRMSSRGSHT